MQLGNDRSRTKTKLKFKHAIELEIYKEYIFRSFELIMKDLIDDITAGFQRQKTPSEKRMLFYSILKLIEISSKICELRKNPEDRRLLYGFLKQKFDQIFKEKASRLFFKIYLGDLGFSSAVEILLKMVRYALFAVNSTKKSLESELELRASISQIFGNLVGKATQDELDEFERTYLVKIVKLVLKRFWSVGVEEFLEGLGGFPSVSLYVAKFKRKRLLGGVVGVGGARSVKGVREGERGVLGGAGRRRTQPCVEFGGGMRVAGLGLKNGMCENLRGFGGNCGGLGGVGGLGGGSRAEKGVGLASEFEITDPRNLDQGAQKSAQTAQITLQDLLMTEKSAHNRSKDLKSCDFNKIGGRLPQAENPSKSGSPAQNHIQSHQRRSKNAQSPHPPNQCSETATKSQIEQKKKISPSQQKRAVVKAPRRAIKSRRSTPRKFNSELIQNLVIVTKSNKKVTKSRQNQSYLNKNPKRAEVVEVSDPGSSLLKKRAVRKLRTKNFDLEKIQKKAKKINKKGQKSKIQLSESSNEVDGDIHKTDNNCARNKDSGVFDCCESSFQLVDTTKGHKPHKKLKKEAGAVWKKLNNTGKKRGAKGAPRGDCRQDSDESLQEVPSFTTDVSSMSKKFGGEFSLRLGSLARRKLENIFKRDKRRRKLSFDFDTLSRSVWEGRVSCGLGGGDGGVETGGKGALEKEKGVSFSEWFNDDIVAVGTPSEQSVCDF